MNRTSITIKEDHFKEIQKVIKHSELFGNPEDYLDYVLDELLLSPSADLDDNKHEVLEQRLRDLGYL